MGIYLVEIYRTPNIGVFLKTNDKFILIPKGLSESKSRKLANNLHVEPYYVSIAGSRLLGPLIAINNNGILVSRITEDYELNEIALQTGLNVERFASKYTAVGNLVAANDKGAIVSPILEATVIRQVKDVMGTDVERLAIHEYVQVGSFIVATSNGAAVYPNLRDDEIEMISSILGVEAHPISVNGGIPYVSSGLVANSKNAIVGELTTGPELIFLTKALKV
jgi:translation initiation factor 6